MKRKIGFFLLIIIFVMSATYLSRVTIFEKMAEYLIVNEDVNYVDYAFVLSGNALDRGQKAAEMYHKGKIGKIVCLGANQSNDLKTLGVDTLESELTQIQLIQEGVAADDIILLPMGTSTAEEAVFVLKFCLLENIQNIAIVSSSFHTKRVEKVFKKPLEEEGISVAIIGASSSVYDEARWWENEYGLIALNNEYVKLIYYFFKY